MQKQLSQQNELTLKISPDIDPENPRTGYDNASVMVCWHRRYKLGDQQPKQSPNAWRRQRKSIKLIKPLYLYDHSGLTIATTPFSCPWDSGQVGWVYIPAATIKKEWGGDVEKAEACLEAEVETYDQYLQGDVWGYEIFDEDDDVVDSCWGFYGDDAAKEAGEEALKHLQG